MTRRLFPILSMILALVLCLDQASLAQKSKSNDADAESRIKKLIDSRRGEHWDYLETQLALTLPPRWRPVHLLPEWNSASQVMFAFDVHLIHCLWLNVEAGCQGQEKEVKNHSPELAKSPLFISVQKRFGYTQEQLFGELGLAHTLLSVLNNISRYMRVLVLIYSDQMIPGSSEGYLHFTVDLLKQFPSGAELLNSNRADFIQIPLNTLWLRDYGPIFVKDANKQVVCVDTRYHTGRESQENQQRHDYEKELLKAIKKLERPQQITPTSDQQKTELDQDAGKNDRGRFLDDVSPSVLASRLRQKTGGYMSQSPISVVRPPLALDGGDLLTDGNGTGFTSTQTLALNGGSTESLDLIFKEYFGVTNIVYLQPLPGSTVKHIDMFLKIAAPNVILIGTYENRSNSEVAKPLQVEAQRILNYDLNLLKSFYEHRKKRVKIITNDLVTIDPGSINIICVPMPDVSRPVLEEIEKFKQDLQKEEVGYQEKAEHFSQLQTQLKDITALKDELEALCKELGDSKKKEKAAFTTGKRSTVIAKLRSSASNWATSQPNYLLSSAWALVLQRTNELDQFLQKKKALNKQENQILIARLQNTAKALGQLISQIERLQSSIESELTNKLAGIRSQAEQLDNQLKIGSDIYRTFLNSLYVRSGNSNLLLFPVYKGLERIQARVEPMFRKIHTKLYGNVKIIPVDSDYLIEMSGTIHCLTQTIPGDIKLFSDDWDYTNRIKR